MNTRTIIDGDNGTILRAEEHDTQPGWEGILDLSEQLKILFTQWNSLHTNQETICDHPQGETDLMSENKFSRYELLKLEMPFLPQNWWERGGFHSYGALTTLFDWNELKVILSNVSR